MDANRERWAWRKGKFATHPQGSGRCRSRFAATMLVTFFSLAGARRIPAQNNGSSEYQVKAAFLFHFAQFVEWPPETFKDADTPLTYCTIGDDPFQGALEQSLSGKTIGARSLHVRHLRETRGIQDCQVLFLGAEEMKRVGEAMASARGHAVLTVGETDHFAADGGVIGFFVEANKIRFEINLDAAEKANLKISARLLALAKTVIGNPKGN